MQYSIWWSYWHVPCGTIYQTGGKDYRVLLMSYLNSCKSLIDSFSSCINIYQWSAVTNSYVNITWYIISVSLLFSELLFFCLLFTPISPAIGYSLTKPLFEFSSCKSDSTYICHENRIHPHTQIECPSMNVFMWLCFYCRLCSKRSASMK